MVAGSDAAFCAVSDDHRLEMLGDSGHGFDGIGTSGTWQEIETVIPSDLESNSYRK